MTSIAYLYENSSMTLQEIADTLGLKLTSTWKFTKQNYSPQYRKNRKVKNYSRSKLGEKNPVYGKTGVNHPNYKGEVSDGKGYVLILKPSWYTGRKGCKHVFVQHIVICEHLGITEIPRGYCVHHKDENKLNNTLSNLEYMTTSAHTTLHQAMRLEEGRLC